MVSFVDTGRLKYPVRLTHREPKVSQFLRLLQQLNQMGKLTAVRSLTMEVNNSRISPHGLVRYVYYHCSINTYSKKIKEECALSAYAKCIDREMTTIE
jgi:hypothetical protein